MKAANGLVRQGGFKRRFFRWIYQLSLFAVAAIIAVFLLEVGFRLSRRGSIGFDRLEWGAGEQVGQPTKIYEKTNEFEFSATMNQHGFRGAEISLKKADGIRRIVILGDSFEFGWGVNDEQTFSYLLDQEINRGQRRYEIINAAGGSLSPLIYYVMLKKKLLEFRPDVVVVFLNYADIREDYLYKRNIIRDAHNHIMDVNPLYIDGRLDFWRWLRNKSELCSYTYNKVWRTFRKIQLLGFWTYIKTKLRGERSRDVMFGREQAIRKEIPPIEFDPYFMLREHADVEGIKKYWSETSQYLSMIHELLRRDQIPLILTVLPNGVQVGPNQWNKGRTLWGFEQGRVYDNPLMRDLFHSFAREHGIGFVDLLPFFKEAGDRPLFFNRDGHLRPEGHAALAKGLLSSPDFRAKLDLR